MNKIVKSCLALLLAAGMTACSSSTPSSQGAMTPGTYTASAKGNNGDVTVEVTVDEQSIVSFTVTDHQETEGIADGALATIPQAIVDQQSLNIDTVSGATYTSNAILEAAADCLQQAGADVEALKTKEKEAAQAKAAGAVVLGLGPRILRCETAPLAALCAVMTLTGNLG